MISSRQQFGTQQVHIWPKSIIDWPRSQQGPLWKGAEPWGPADEPAIGGPTDESSPGLSPWDPSIGSKRGCPEDESTTWSPKNESAAGSPTDESADVRGSSQSLEQVWPVTQCFLAVLKATVKGYRT